MRCSRCGRPPTHGGVFVDVGDEDDTSPVCGPCFVEGSRTPPGDGQSVAPPPERARVPAKWLREGWDK